MTSLLPINPQSRLLDLPRDDGHLRNKLKAGLLFRIPSVCDHGVTSSKLDGHLKVTLLNHAHEDHVRRQLDQESSRFPTMARPTTSKRAGIAVLCPSISITLTAKGTFSLETITTKSVCSTGIRPGSQSIAVAERGLAPSDGKNLSKA